MRTSAARAAPLALVLAAVAPLAPVAFTQVLACGGAPAAQPMAVAPKPAAPPAPPPPDLSAVPDPASLVLSGGFGKMGASLAMVHSFSQLPMPQSEQLTEVLTGEAIGPVIDVDQPVYFALAIVGSGMAMKPPLVAVSAAVKDPDKVKSALAERFKLIPGDNGTTLIEGLGRRKHKAADPDAQDEDDADQSTPSGDTSSDGDDDDGRTCELAASAGDAPVRIVCGLSAASLSELGPWLTRTAPRTAPPTDLRAELRMAPLEETIAEGKKLAGMLLGSVLGGALRVAWARELMLAAAGDAADLASDIDGVTFDVTLADTGTTAHATMKLSGHASLVGRLATGHPERSGPAPSPFWMMPADADFAFFSRGVDEAAIAHARQLVVDAVAGGLVEDGAKAPDASAVASALGKLLTSAPLVYASGLDEGAARKAIAAEHALGADADPAARAEAKRATTQSLLGWRVLEVDQKSPAIVSALKDLAGGMTRASLVASLRAHDKSAAPLVLRPAPIAKASGLPAAALQWVLEIPTPAQKVRRDPDAKPARKAPAPPKPILVHIVVTPDGDRTWIGMGGDEAAVASRLAALPAGKSHLDGRPELASLKTATIGSGGFFTAKGIPQTPLQLRLLAGGSALGASEALQDLEQMPQKGMTPMVFSTTAVAGGVVGELSVPRAAIEDFVGSILRHGGF